MIHHRKQRVLILKSSNYQPSKAELEEKIKLDIPGKDVHERAKKLAQAALQAVKIRFEKH